VPGFEILGELGRGGMGVVYKARHLGLKRVVALKMILVGAHAGGEELRRFRTEAETLARLQHPNVVQIYEVGEQGGLPYCALEFVGGGSLDRRLADGPLRPDEAADLAAKLARAIHAAHQAGIVHRDLKPANVLLTEDGTPKITDFGLAKKLEGASALTASGAIMGTPSYMPPEQAGGQAKTVGPAADIYSLGAILYELLTGRPPFRAATTMDTILQVVSEEPKPLTALKADVPRELELICLKCLKKDPRQRYATAQDLAEDLRRYRDHEAVSAVPETVMGWWWKRLRRQPLVAALSAALALVLVLVLPALYKQWRQAENLLQPEREARQLAERRVRDQAAALSAAQTRTMQLEESLRKAQTPAPRVTFSPDGTRVVTPAGSSQIELWAAATGKRVAALNAASDPVAFSPDSRLFAGAFGVQVTVWESATAKPVRTVRAPFMPTAVAVSPTGQVAVGGDGAVSVWEADSKEPLPPLTAADPGRRPVLGLSFVPGGPLLAVDFGAAVKVFDLSSGQAVQSLRPRP
jgi:hypothetical protein